MLTIRKASAGSGKTFQLARQYIIDVLADRSVNEDGTTEVKLNRNGSDAHRRILAITFTNKATAEMKARIVSEMAKLAYVGPNGEMAKSDHRDFICAKLGCDEKDLQKAAAVALKSILFSYHHFNVSTIDSFFQLVLRNFAREADLPGDFGVEIDDREVISFAVQMMLDRGKREMAARADGGNSGRGDASSLVRLIESFMNDKSEAGKKFNIFNSNSTDVNDITKAISDLLNEDYKINSDLQQYLVPTTGLSVEAAAAAKEQAAKRLADFAKEVKRLYSVRIYEIIGKAKDFRKKYVDYDNMAYSHAKNVFVKLADGDLSPFSSKTFPKIINDGHDYFNKKKPDDAICEDIQERANEINRLKEELFSFECISAHIDKMQFLQAVLADVEQYRSDNDLILLSDTNDILHALIGKSDVPFVYEKIGTEIVHFLLDEFQDTSRMQWNNLRPLISNSEDDATSDNLIIGDEKQSIYRFRNADYRLLYSGVRDDIKVPDERIVTGKDAADNTNWRSSRDIVEFNNKFFAKYAESSGNATAKDIYKYVEQKVAPKNENRRGCVIMRKSEAENDGSFKKQSFEQFVNDLKRARRDGFRWGDMAVLTNKKEEGRELIDYVMQYVRTHPGDNDFAGFKVVSEESLLISRADSVQFVVAMLRLLDPTNIENERDGKEAKSAAEIAYRYRYAAMRARENGYTDFSKVLADALSDADMPELLKPEKVASLYVDDRCASLVTIVEKIIRAHIPKKLLAEENIYLQAFADIVIDMSNRGVTNAHDFLSWWDSVGKGQGVTLPSGADMMQVMTIHKSKGLEFPCVFIPLAKWELKKNDGTSWFSTDVISDSMKKSGVAPKLIPPMLPLKNTKKLIDSVFSSQYEDNNTAAYLDSLNKAYVAFTRAKDRLVVTYMFKEGKNEDKKEGKNDGKKIFNKFGDVTDNVLADFGIDCVEQTVTCGDNTLYERIYGDAESKCNEKHNSADGSEKAGEPAIGGKSMSADEMEEYKVGDYATSNLNENWELLTADENLPYVSPSIREGLILHDVMRSVHDLKSDVLTLVRRKAMRFALTDEVIEEYADIIRGALADPRVKPWFSGFVRLINERPVVIMSEGKGPVSQRPDRVVVNTDGSVDIVDYKFGGRDDSRYRRQMKGYVGLYKSLGYTTVRAHLWYVKLGEIVDIPVN